MADKFITREDAVNQLSDLIGVGILSKTIEDNLEDIIQCIECECDGYHIWGADSDVMQLYIGYREDLWTDELKEKMQKLADEHTFIPAPYEKDDVDGQGSEEDGQETLGDGEESK